MMFKIKNKFYFVFVFLLLACSAVTYDYELPNVKEKIVVNSLFGTDAPFRVSVSKSQSRTETNELAVIGDAQVIIYEDNAIFDTLNIDGNSDANYAISNVFYKGGKIPAGNREYRISVRANGMDSVYAINSIPAQAKIDFIDYEIVQTTEQYRNNYLRVNLKVSECNNNGYYYLAVAQGAGFSNTKRYTLFDINDPIIGTSQNGSEMDYVLFAGDLISDKSYSFSLDLKENFYLTLNKWSVIYFELISLSNEAYRYLKTVTAQKNVDERVSEPIKVFTNIEGGYGIFAGVNTAMDSLVWGD